jgi:diguanylate cyclase (GGDEF)-like protein/PAS domain S-box-containing protein
MAFPMIDWFGRLRIRTKLTFVMSALVAAVSMLILFYFPAKFRRASHEATRQTAESTSTIAARALGSRMVSVDPTATASFIAALREHDDLVYAIVHDTRGAVAGAFNERFAESVKYRSFLMEASTGAARRSETRGAFIADGSIYQTSAPIRYRGRVVGTIFLGFSLRKLETELADAQRKFALIAFAVLLIGVLLANGLSALVTGPLRRIAGTAELIAGGARGLRATVPFPDEVGQLATSINSMVSEMEQSQREVEELNAVLEKRVNERTQKLLEESEVRHRAEMALKSSQERYRALFDRNPAGVYIMSMDGKLIAANAACATLFGHPDSDSFIRDGKIRYADASIEEDLFRELKRTGTVTNFEAEVMLDSGETRWVLQNARLTTSGDDSTIEGILLDVTDRKRSEIDIEHRAFHDALTGMPNRALLEDRLRMAVVQATRKMHPFALFFIDLDDLKGINDTFGHEAGDHLLKDVAARFQEVVESADTVARIGGDEFTILVPFAGFSEAKRIAEKLAASLAHPITLGTEEIFVSASIGIALYPDNGSEAESLLRTADRTMYHVKERGGNSYRFADADDSSKGLRRASLQEELANAIERGELVPYYQPQFDLETREMTGVEALVRWQHPEGIVLSPTGFIPLAEQTGLISALGRSILEQSAAQVRSWHERGLSSLRLSVNVSPRQLHQKDFVGSVMGVLEEAKFRVEMLELELTESIAMYRSRRITQMLDTFRSLGISIAVDDFGTGNSSLSYLKQFNFDTVKIDKSFVQDMFTDRNDLSIVTSVLYLANQLGLRTIAEGVESEEQCRFLIDAGCRIAQGFLFSRPLSAPHFEAIYLSKSAPLEAFRG